MFAVAAWRKPVAPAAASTFLPPIGAAALARLFWFDDDSLTHIAVGLSCVTTLVTFLVVRDRVPPEGRCPTCGYDLRGHRGERCPECGASPEPRPSPASHRRGQVLRGTMLLATMVVGGVLHALLIRGRLGLG